MNRTAKIGLQTILCLMAMLPGVCQTTESRSNAAETHAAAPRIVPIPSAVRSHLGIKFATVERRKVQEKLRLPGRFELAHSARAEYRAPSRGRVEFFVELYDEVTSGTPLFSLATPEWTALLQEIREAEEDAELVMRQREAQQAAVEATRQAVELWTERTTALERLLKEVGGQAAQLTQAQAELSRAKSEHALATARMREVEHLVHAIYDDVTGENPKFLSAISTAALFLGVRDEWLLEEVGGKPRWYGLRSMVFVAKQDGVVDRLGVTRGGVAAENELIISTVDPGQILFRGFALQTHLQHLEDGQVIEIVPPRGGAGEPLAASLRLATEANPVERTFDIIAIPADEDQPEWVRAGVTGFAEVAIAGTGEEELAIPRAAVIRDGMEMIFFLRDQSRGDRARRIVANLGTDDGRWVVVKNAVREGDLVVVEGVHELKLSLEARGTDTGGHMHADGTFHGSH